MTYRLRLLGQPALEGPGGEIPLASGPAEALLCFLAAQPMRLFGPSQLGAVFGEPDPAALARLRSTLPVWPVREVEAGIGWDTAAAVAVDTSLFREFVGEADGHPSSESLQAAVALWRGGFLEGMHLPASPTFTEWVFRKRQHWKDWFLETHARLVERGEGTRAGSAAPVPDQVDLAIISMLSGQPLEAITASPSSRSLGALLIRDALTGLYNRQYLQRRLTVELQGARESGMPIALLVMDLNGFKQINDTLGHAAGDRMIVAVGEALGHHIQGAGVAARYGGDEFVAALFGLSRAEVEALAHRLLTALERLEVTIDGGQPVHSIRASIGIAEYGLDGQEYSSLFDAADQAMYHAKRHLGGGVFAHATLHRQPQAAPPEVRGAPRGLVTFVLCQREGAPGDGPFKALAGHDALVSSYLERHGGLVFRVGQNASRLYAAFSDCRDALVAAGALQQALQVDPQLTGVAGGIRIALHTGEAEFTGSEYTGPAIAIAGALADVGHPAQVLLSAAAADRARPHLSGQESLRDLGAHRLRDLHTSAQIYQYVTPALDAEFPPLRSLSVLPNNLPAQVSAFIGRDGEIQEVRERLATARLLTLAGPGGAGKTRLCMRVAAELVEKFADGVWVVELASLSEPGQVLQAVAGVTGMRDLPGRLTVGGLTDFLAPRRMLLLLDNCEHLLQPCADLADALLRICPHLRLLTTSREPLGITGEVVWRVPPLSLPDPDHLPPLDDLVMFDGVRFFVERARLSTPDFALTAANAPAVVTMCHRLDGAPLALELAAARLKSLSVAEILDRLDDRFRLLTGGNRAATPRQQTLRALVDWSHDLLAEPARVLWRRLAVFPDRFSLQAAEAICGEAPLDRSEVMDLLAQLVDKSLVVTEEQNGEARFRLLETMREYGAEKLRGAGETEQFRRRHRDWYVGMLGEVRPRLTGPEQHVWLNRLDAEAENLWAALRWCRQQGDVETELNMVVGLWSLWASRQTRRGREWMEGLLCVRATHEYPELRAEVLRGAGSIAFFLGDHQAAVAHFRESVALWRQLGHERSLALTLNNLAFVITQAGQLDEATALLEEALSMGRTIAMGNPLVAMGRLLFFRGDSERATAHFYEALRLQRDLASPRVAAHALYCLADVVRSQGDYPRAERLFEDALGHYRSLGDKSYIALCLMYLGRISEALGNWDQARSRYTGSLRLYREMSGGLKIGEADCLEGFAALALAGGDAERAARILGAVELIRSTYGIPVAPPDRPAYDRLVARVRSALGEQAYGRETADGQAMSLNRVTEYALVD